ncbi:ArsA-related P-loop ATPase [Bacteriovorax sp. Seq25_V]|uniref:ArsA family ATPase n=1 Tax=Bacteriovorax sp. Seq25_V TaxID=1201288 RepID=UPI00038A17AC|nr:ArsA-related P-loop ATPase [Bacteriovorax sp. Seq25_V]EQC47249.1 anion-transporting ATPase [Bacteriovorax sp. Seq25_V]
MLKNKRIEIFCGTGGVGKTTISTSRALHLAKQGRNTLLITIDPAKRLKQVLGIDEEEQGHVVPVSKDSFSIPENVKLDALLLDPSSTLERIVGEKLENDILRTLARPHGGLNEIMAVLEVQHHFNSRVYDTIVLDTPPGQHFIDFLEASRKIKQFFDKTFAEIFNVIDDRNKTKKFLTKIVASGVDKLLTYLEKVTGKTFVAEFTQAIRILYGSRNTFIDGLKLEDELINPELTNWFLVTSADQVKGQEANHLFESSSKFNQSDNYIIINKSWSEFIKNWEPQNNNQVALKENFTHQLKQIKDNISNYNIQTIEFPEVFENQPSLQVEKLLETWEKI